MALGGQLGPSHIDLRPLLTSLLALTMLFGGCTREDSLRTYPLVPDGWQVDFEVQFPAGIAELATIQAIASGSLGTGNCFDVQLGNVSNEETSLRSPR